MDAIAFTTSTHQGVSDSFSSINVFLLEDNFIKESHIFILSC